MNVLLIRADATSQIGTGHIMRCLALAQAWQDLGGKPIFLSYCDSKALHQRIESEGFEFIDQPAVHPDPSDLKCTLKVLKRISKDNDKQDTWLVLDGYHFDSDYQLSIKKDGFKLLWIDDYGHARHYYADIILNQNIYADASLYCRRELYTRLLLGPRFALLRREFRLFKSWEREIPDKIRRILVTMGGSDPDNVTLKIVQLLKQIFMESLEIIIVTGPAYLYRNQLLQEIESSGSKLDIVTSPEDMPDLMAGADVAISGGGSTCLELAFMGLPFLVIVLAQNQLLNCAVLQQRGLALNVGSSVSVDQDVVKKVVALNLDKDQRRKMSHMGRRMVDGNGSERIIEAMY